MPPFVFQLALSLLKQTTPLLEILRNKGREVKIWVSSVKISRYLDEQLTSQKQRIMYLKNLSEADLLRTLLEQMNRLCLFLKITTWSMIKYESDIDINSEH